MTDILTEFTQEDITAVEKLIAENQITRLKCPWSDLYILNYTKECAYKKNWNKYTEECRGLIVDGDWNIVSRPFKKFYNDFELEATGTEIPWDMKFKAYEKLDGSLGISYRDDSGEARIATRGSFGSDQALHATRILHSKYGNVEMNPDYTYMFEIIYPDNHIVVNYGDTDDIILIAAIETATGREADLSEFENSGFKLAKTYDCTDLKSIRDQFSGNNREGFVIKFENGLRMKMKYDRYFELHSAMWGLSEKKTFKMYEEGGKDAIKDFITRLDEENTKIVREWISEFEQCTESVIRSAEELVPDESLSDREAAEIILMNRELAPVVFDIRKKRDPHRSALRVVKKRLGF